MKCFNGNILHPTRHYALVLFLTKSICEGLEHTIGYTWVENLRQLVLYVFHKVTTQQQTTAT